MLADQAADGPMQQKLCRVLELNPAQVEQAMKPNENLNCLHAL